jgi:hypothetical protein
VLTVLIVLGVLGLAVVLAGLLLGEILDGALDAVAPGDVAPGLTPAVGAAVSAFGFGGALALRGADLAAPLALALATAGALVVGGAAFALARVVIGETSAAPTGTDLYGVFGSLVTPVPPNGYGEVTVVVHGTRRKLAARAEEPLPAGATVYVLEVLSDTSVLVAPADPLALI